MSATPVNVQIPSDPQAPIIADFVEHALRVAYVDRAHLTALPRGDWNSPGVYLLLSGDGTGRIYVGQARRIRSRLMNHNTNEQLPWRRAIAVKRDTSNGFNTAEIGYLEGRVSAEVAALENITVIEGQTSGDQTLPRHLMISLDSFVKSILGALRLAGVDTTRRNPEESLEDLAEVGGAPVGRASYPAKFTDLVSSGLIAAGESLFLKQGRTEATGSVTADGEIVVRGVAYKSPSSAAANALGQSSNGWTTWRVGGPTGPTLDSLRRQWLQDET